MVYNICKLFALWLVVKEGWAFLASTLFVGVCFTCGRVRLCVHFGFVGFWQEYAGQELLNLYARLTACYGQAPPFH